MRTLNTTHHVRKIKHQYDAMGPSVERLCYIAEPLLTGRVPLSNNGHKIEGELYQEKVIRRHTRIICVQHQPVHSQQELHMLFKQ